MTGPLQLPWHREARALRANGVSINRIAMKLNRSSSSVRYAVDETGERRKTAARVLATRARARERRKASAAGDGAAPPGY